MQFRAIYSNLPKCRVSTANVLIPHGYKQQEQSLQLESRIVGGAAHVCCVS